jgi:protein-tyrosine phosphatase
MPAIVDMHCHVLPGVDDGPSNMDESLAVLREAKRQGVEKMIVTPHYHPGRFMVPAPRVLETLQEVRDALEREGIELQLIPGQECYYYSGLVKELDAGNVLTMGGTSHVLVEFDPGVLYSVIQHAVRELFNGGYRPIIAHFERYDCLHGREDRLKELRDQDVMLQLNFDRLLDREGFFRRNVWRRLLRDGWVDLLGSDTHGMGFRPLHIAQAVQWLVSDVEPRIVSDIFENNFGKLLEKNR